MNEGSISYFLEISNEPITWFAQGIHVSIMRLGDQSYFFSRKTAYGKNILLISQQNFR